MSNADGRNIALTVLTEVLEHDGYSHLVMQKEFEKHPELDERERHFAERLIRGTIQRKITLDHILGQVSNTPLRKMKPVVRNILRMGVYQILYMDAVPDRAACSEAVRLTRKRGLSGLSGFVNGVLRNVIRQRDCFKMPDQRTATYLSVQYSMPEWLVTRWLSEYGRERCENLLASFLTERALTIRPNTEKTDADSLQKRLESEGIRVRRLEHPSYAMEIGGFGTLSEMAAFREGLFYIQDTASMQVADFADPKKGDLVIDLCGAPGGKSVQIAQMLKGTGQVITRDLSEEKVSLIRQNIARMDLVNMRAEVHDARVSDPGFVGMADLVIADLPCSGLGVTGRKPDIKYRICPEDIASLSGLQREILTVAATYVKHGGSLVYSTCTITPEENADNAEWFTKAYPQFVKIAEKQFMPWDGTDGFFIAKWERR